MSGWERFKRLWVWHPSNTSPDDPERWSVRIWLPGYDVLAIAGAYMAIRYGTPLLNNALPEWLLNTAGALYGLAGLSALIGICIPRLWHLEAVGKVGVAFLLTSYAILVLSRPNSDSGFVVVTVLMATWSIYPRLTRLFIRGIRDKEHRKAPWS